MKAHIVYVDTRVFCGLDGYFSDFMRLAVREEEIENYERRKQSGNFRYARKYEN